VEIISTKLGIEDRQILPDKSYLKHLVKTPHTKVYAGEQPEIALPPKDGLRSTNWKCAWTLFDSSVRTRLPAWQALEGP
jgi:hypothetical protein